MLVTRGFASTYVHGPDVPVPVPIVAVDVSSNNWGDIHSSGKEVKPGTKSSETDTRPSLASFSSPLSLDSTYSDMRPKMSGKQD